jgi:hypothetical protein
MGLNHRSMAILTLMCTLLAGCASYNRQKDIVSQEKIEQYSVPHSKAYGTMMPDPKQHHNTRFEYSHDISTAVTSVDGVATSIVMLTDRNAYVAVVMDSTASDIKGNAGLKEQNNIGTSKGIYYTGTSNGLSDGRKVVTNYNSYYTLNDHNDLGKEFKQRIAEKVRSMSPYIREVHISANKEFINSMAEIAKQLWLGKPMKPLVSTFNQLVIKEFAPAIISPGKQKYNHMPSNRK